MRIILAVALAVASGAAGAQDEGFYLGGSLGQSRFKEWCDTGGSTITLSSCKDTDTAWKILGGYRFNRNVGLEASYLNWGEVTATAVSAGQVVDVSAKQRSYGLAAVGSLQVTAAFSVFGKLGFLMTEQETRRLNPNPSTVDRDETELHYGLGARYALTANWLLRGEWEGTEKLKAEMLSIGVEYRF